MIDSSIFKKKTLTIQDIKFLLNFSEITDKEKQLYLEKLLNLPQDYSSFLEILQQDTFVLKLKEIRESLTLSLFLNGPGKSFFKKFFKPDVMDFEVYIECIIFGLFFKVLFTRVKGFALTTIKDILLTYICLYYKQNKSFEYLNKIKSLVDLESVSCYTLAILVDSGLLVYDKLSSQYYVKNFNFDELTFNGLPHIRHNYYFFYLKDNWPFLIPPKPFTIEGFGGYYTFDYSIYIRNKYTRPLSLTERGLVLLNKYQNTPFYLNTNKFVDSFLRHCFSFFEQNIAVEKARQYKINELTYKLLKVKNKNFKFDLTEYYKDTWYLLLQFLTLKDAGYFKIYYTFEVDFRARIYNNIHYGLNPTTNKLCRFLLNRGEYVLTKEGFSYLKDFIFSKFKIKSDIEFTEKLNYVQSLIDSNFSSIKETDYLRLDEIVVLIDWQTNVIPNNKTEILVELDAHQSGFQILSLFSNSEKGLTQTNIMNTTTYDFYSSFLTHLRDLIKSGSASFVSKKTGTLYSLTEDCFFILTRKLIKKILMTKPYNSTLWGQVDMLLESFNDEYGLISLSDTSVLNKIIDSKIIASQEVLNEFIFFRDSLINDSLYLNKTETQKFESLYTRLITLQHLLETDLKSFFIPLVCRLLNDIMLKEYSDVFELVEGLTTDFNQSPQKYANIQTPFFNFTCLYFQENEHTLKVLSSVFKKYSIDTTKYDLKKSKTALIANLCHGHGDAFIMYTLMEHLIDSNIYFYYTIHDALLCNSNDVSLIQKSILFSYKSVYSFLFSKSCFLFGLPRCSQKFDLKSLNIFKIK